MNVIEMNTQGQRNDGSYTIDTSRGGTHGAVSSQWWTRPDDQRFLSIPELYKQVNTWAEESYAALVQVKDIQVKADREDAESLRLVLPEGHAPAGIEDESREVAPTHWSFGQVCGLLEVPASYLRRLPGPIAGINLQYALANFREELIKPYVRVNGASELRAATGPQYGRILDRDVVSAVAKIAGDGTSGPNGSHWKIPGVIQWDRYGTKYNPHAAVTKQSTTLFASDRDVFMFLVDDTHPIEIGKLDNGDPDLVFRGFYVWNSETGSKTMGLASMLLRGVCQNRMLWGVEQFSELKIRHSSGAPQRFMLEAKPALESYAMASASGVLQGIKAARDAVVAKSDEDRVEFLARQGFTKPETKSIITAVLEEEHKAPESIWDFVQGITASARGKGHQDERLELERKAGKLLEKVAN